MKTRRSRHPQYDLFATLQTHFEIDPRRLIVLCALILGMIQTRSVVLWRLVPVVQLGDNENSVYKRLKRFMQYSLSQTMIARFALSFLREEQQLLLLMDRTNWKWGQQDINFLILSVYWRSFSFPLAWTLIPHGANSKSEQRIELLEAVMPLLQSKTVYLLADREFVGKKWFKALKHRHVLPCIRLKADSRVNGIPVWALFRKLQPGEMRYWHKPMRIYGVQLRVLGAKNLFDQTLYLAYHGHARLALERYAKRWNCENMHQAMKSRGFHLEDTNVTDLRRISTLFGVLTLAFMWCCLIGEFEEQREPQKPLKHGYPPKSLFRRGLDALKKAIEDLAWGESSAKTSFRPLLATFVP